MLKNLSPNTKNFNCEIMNQNQKVKMKIIGKENFN